MCVCVCARVCVFVCVATWEYYLLKTKWVIP